MGGRKVCGFPLILKGIGIELNAEYIKIAEKRFLQRELFTGEIK
jgi:DNA modification methylase